MDDHSKPPPKRRRGRKEGSIYRRSDGRWTSALTVGYRNTKRVRKQFYGTTRREVQDQLVKALREDQLGLTINTSKQTVGQFLTQWLEDSVRPKVRAKTFN